MQNVAFQSKYLNPPKGRPIENTVGQRDGESLIRSATISDQNLLARSVAQATAAHRVSQGVAFASMAAIRSITSQDDSSARLFRVYEDPTPLLPQHSVIRFDPAYKHQWAIARTQLKDAFDRKI
jgi:hypothetical protein